jgi:hypothetical protein
MRNGISWAYESSTVQIKCGQSKAGVFLSIVDKLDNNTVVLSYDDLRLLQEALDAVNEG